MTKGNKETIKTNKKATDPIEERNDPRTTADPASIPNNIVD